MKIVDRYDILRRGTLADSSDIRVATAEVEQAVKEISWPPGSKKFVINPVRKSNGVKPIKEACMAFLKGKGWQDEHRLRPRGVAGTGPLDAVKETPYGLFAIEWETGNISSSHRALNKICLGVLNHELAGGVLVLPSKELYPLLTDRIGNYRELVPYLPLWESIPYEEGVIFILVVEHDGVDETVPHIPKGTDGRALL